MTRKQGFVPSEKSNCRALSVSAFCFHRFLIGFSPTIRLIIFEDCVFISDAERVNNTLLMSPLFPNSVFSAKIPVQNA